MEASRRAAEIFLESILERNIFISFIRTWRCLSRGGGGCSRLTGASCRRISGTQWRFCRFIRNSRKGPEPGRSGADWRSGSEGRNKAVGTISRGHRPRRRRRSSNCGNFGPDLLSEHCSLLSWSGATSALCQSQHYRSGLRRTSSGEIIMLLSYAIKTQLKGLWDKIPPTRAFLAFRCFFMAWKESLLLALSSAI